ncbi:MAG: VOC family protein [Gammaproteobacteria bacterium]
MIDHTGIVASDFTKSEEFYSKSLFAIGYSLLLEFSASVTGHTDVAGFGGAFVLGPDGHNIEAVCHAPE